MKQKDQATLGKLLVLSLALLLLAAGPMSYFTEKPPDVIAQPGETVTLQFSFYHNSANWVGSGLGLVQDEQHYGGSDKIVWKGFISQDQTKTFTVDYTVPNTPGTYEVKYRMRAGYGRDTGLGTDIVKFHVEEEPEEPTDPEDPEEPDYEGDLNDMSVFEKIVLLFKTIIAYLMT
jgi:plastocyanin